MPGEQNGVEPRRGGIPAVRGSEVARGVEARAEGEVCCGWGGAGDLRPISCLHVGAVSDGLLLALWCRFRVQERGPTASTDSSKVDGLALWYKRANLGWWGGGQALLGQIEASRFGGVFLS